MIFTALCAPRKQRTAHYQRERLVAIWDGRVGSIATFAVPDWRGSFGPDNGHGLRVDHPLLAAPEILETRRRKFSIAHCVLDVAVAEVGLQSARVVPLVGERVAAGVPQHMRVGLEAQLALDRCPFDHAGDVQVRSWPVASFRAARVGRTRRLPISCGCPEPASLMRCARSTGGACWVNRSGSVTSSQGPNERYAVRLDWLRWNRAAHSIG
jgi:hypothetical protein